MTYCDRCERHFNSYYALDAHKRDSSRHYMCYPCDRDFHSYESLRKHREKSSMHHFCDFCCEDFDCDDELEEHRHICHDLCSDCDLWLDTPKDLVAHNKEYHHYCVECNRTFMSLNNLRAHLNSSKHRPKNVVCPGRGCGAQFVSNGALILHFEGGACKSGVTRSALNRLVAERDTGHFITNSNRMIAGPTQTWATERAWNGSSYECYFCHKQCRDLAGLNQHLASPAHDQAVYHCPKLGHGCQLQFRTLSALCQHIEGGSCGVARFKAVQDSMNSLIKGVKRIGLS